MFTSPYLGAAYMLAHPPYAGPSALCRPIRPRTRSGLLHQLLKDFVRLCAHDSSVAARKGWHARHTFAARFCPVGIHGILERSVLQYVAGLISRQSNRLSDVNENVAVADIAGLRKVRRIERIVNGVEAFSIAPLPKLLREPAVVGMRSRNVRESFRIHQTLQACMNRPEVTPREKVAKQQPLGWRLRVKREVHQTDVEIKVTLQFLNTPGTEVAPGSHVICEDFQNDSIVHRTIVREFSPRRAIRPSAP